MAKDQSWQKTRGDRQCTLVEEKIDEEMFRCAKIRDSK